MSARVRTCGFRCPLFVVFKNITSGTCQHVWERVFSDFHSLLCSRISPQEHVSTFENMCFQRSTLYCVQEYHLRSMPAIWEHTFSLSQTPVFKNITSETCQLVWEHMFSSSYTLVFKNIASGTWQHVWEHVFFNWLSSTVSRILPQEHVSTCENMCFQRHTRQYIRKYHSRSCQLVW
jgi:hypothetical protein